MAAFGTGAQVTPKEGWAIWQRQVTDTAAELWAMMGRDLVATLAARGVADGVRLLWMPPGRMGLVPLELARDGETGRYLLDRYEIAILPSLRMGTAAAPAGPPSLAALVNPTGDLTFSAAEGAMVASHFPAAAQTVLGREVTSADSVLTALADRSYWHLSSHGGFSWADPETSGIILVGGAILSVRDLLVRFGQTAPRLVVLSACESSLADIGPREEYFGLPMALLAGGSQAVIGTQWPASDLATMFLMARFYELYLDPGGQPPSAALRLAQQWLRDASAEALRDYISLAARDGRLSLLDAAKIRDEVLDGYAPDARPFADPVYWADFTITGQ